MIPIRLFLKNELRLIIMTEVTKDEFYSKIGPLDVVLSVLGPFPFTGEFKMRNGHRLVGKYVDVINKDPNPEIDYMTTKYFLI